MYTSCIHILSKEIVFLLPSRIRYRDTTFMLPLHAKLIILSNVPHKLPSQVSCHSTRILLGARIVGIAFAFDVLGVGGCRGVVIRIV